MNDILFGNNLFGRYVINNIIMYRNVNIGMSSSNILIEIVTLVGIYNIGKI